MTLYTVTGEIITMSYKTAVQSGTGIYVTDWDGVIRLFQEDGKSCDEEIENIEISKPYSYLDQYEYETHYYGERYIGYIKTNSGYKVVTQTSHMNNADRSLKTL